MEVPQFLYPKYEERNLVYMNKNSMNPKDIKLFKNLKLVRDFKDLETEYEEYFLEENKKTRDTLSLLTEEEVIFEEKNELLDFLDGFRKNKFMNKKYNLGKYFTNAFRKMYEICMRTDFVEIGSRKIRHFDICGMPGGFVFAINHFLKTRRRRIEYDWYIQSYIKDEGDEAYFDDYYGLIKKNRQRHLTGDGTGDITKPENIEIYYDFFKKKRCDIVSSDCGLGMDDVYSLESKSYTREKQMSKIFYGQLICGMLVLKKGGNFFMKTYHSFSPFFISLVYLLGLNFKKVSIVKPESSRQPGGREIYLLCFDLKRELGDAEKDSLVSILSDFDGETLNKNLISTSKMDKKIIINIQEKLIRYYSTKMKLKIRKYKFTEQLFEFFVTEDKEKYFERKKEILEQMRWPKLEYYKKYFGRMGYRKIKDTDRLV